MRKYTRFDAQSLKDAMIFNMNSIGKYMLEIILHQQRTPYLLKQKKLMQTQEDHSNPIPTLNVDSLKVDSVVIQNTCSEKKDSNSETASSKSVKECNLDSATNIVLSKENLKGTRIKHGFKRAFMSLFHQDADTFTRTIFLNYTLDYDSQMTDKYFAECTRIKVTQFRETLLQHMCNVKKSVVETTRHQRQYERRVNKKLMLVWLSQKVVEQNQKCKKTTTVTQHYLPKKIESVVAIASSSSRNSSKNILRFSSNDMVHNHYLDEARKKTHERDRSSKTRVMHTASPQTTTKDSKPKLRSNNQTSRSLPEVNLRAKIQSHKTRNHNKPVDQKSHTQIPGRQIFTGHRFSPTKTSAVYEKTSPRSDLRWKPTGRIFKSVGLRWIPTGKSFDSCTSKVDSEPTHGSNSMVAEKADISETIVEVDSKLISKMVFEQLSSSLKHQCQMTFDHNRLSLDP
nr:hypothetical protein [Tanacetum cinerariifolium]